MRLGEATSKEQLLAACEEALLRRQMKRRSFEAVWWNNISLITGDHYSDWNPFHGEVVPRVPIDRKTRLVVNYALKVARKELAKLMKSRPLMTVMAASDESTDIDATKVGLLALDHLEWKFQLANTRKKALWWMIPCGVSAVHVGWDPANEKDGKAVYYIDPNTGEPVFNPSRINELKQLEDEGTVDGLKKEEFALGDVDYKVYSAFQLYPDETATDFRNIRDLITTDVVDVDEAYNTWGIRLNPEQVYLGTIERRMLQRMSAGTSLIAQPPVDNAAMVHTLWLLPGRYGRNTFLKNGILARWAQGKIIEFAPAFPFADGRMPFAFFQHVPANAVIWPESVMTHIRPLNLEIDKIVSQMIETKDHMSNPMWVVATQQQVKGRIKNQAGGIIRYVHVNGIPPPQPITGITMPAGVEELGMMLKGQMDDISGQYDFSRQTAPSGLRSGSMIAYLQEESDSLISPTIEDMEEAVAMMSSLSLERLGQFYSTERMLRVYRRNGIFDVRKFKGANLRGNTDVIPIVGSALPKSKAARQQYILELAQLGILRDPKQIMEALDIGQGEPTDLDKDYAQALRENNIMLYGIKGGPYAEFMTFEQGTDGKKNPVAVPVKSWHNHQVHLEMHYGMMKEEEFDRMALTNPEIVRLFDEHVSMHEQILQQRAQQQMQMIQAMKGAPDGPPGQASQPSYGEPGFVGNQNLSSLQGTDAIGGGALSLSSRRSSFS